MTRAIKRHATRTRGGLGKHVGASICEQSISRRYPAVGKISDKQARYLGNAPQPQACIAYLARILNPMTTGR